MTANDSDDIDIEALAAEAHKKGYGNPERLIERLRKIIGRNAHYVNRPYRKGRGFNEVIEEDNEVLAYLIEIIEELRNEGGAL
jgi:hypothetical protein